MTEYNPETRVEVTDNGLSEFVRLLIEIDKNLSIECVDDTYEIEADCFTLTFTVDDETFEIRSIDVRGNTGLGSKIVMTINDYADENDLQVIASNVRDAARGFWERMGFQEGPTMDEYFRVT